MYVYSCNSQHLILPKKHHTGVIFKKMQHCFNHFFLNPKYVMQASGNWQNMQFLGFQNLHNS